LKINFQNGIKGKKPFFVEKEASFIRDIE